MTVQEAIDRIDNLNPNQYGTETKMAWLNNLELLIFNDVILRHHPLPMEPFKPHTDSDEYLIVNAPYDELYVAYLHMKIDEANQETTRYNNSLSIFEARYEDFKKYYNRTRKPVCEAKFRLW